MKKYTSIYIVLTMVMLSGLAAAAANDSSDDTSEPAALSEEWVNVSGSVKVGDVDVCALVVINGQSMFTCGASLGRYDLQVPPDTNGKLSLQAFVKGQEAFKKTISATSTDTDILLQPASPDSKFPSVATIIDTHSARAGWARISGTITSGGQRVCGLSLANGQRQFTCGDNHGLFYKQVPLNSDKKVEHFFFADGFQPHQQILTADAQAQLARVMGTSGNPVELEGTWVTDCFFDTAQNAYVIFEQTFEDFTLSRSEKFWSASPQCEGPSDLTFRLEADFTLGKLINVNLDGIDEPATRLDIDFSNAWIVINNSQLIDAYNNNQVCGIDNWLVGVDQNILGTDCAPDSTNKDIIHVNDDDIDQPQAAFGDRTGAVDSDGYPKTLGEIRFLSFYF